MKQPNLERYFRALESEQERQASTHQYGSYSWHYHDGKADAYGNLAILASEGRIPVDMKQTEMLLETQLNER